eukprot:1196250-Prorocentrum_minimum.AAC.1
MTPKRASAPTTDCESVTDNSDIQESHEPGSVWRKRGLLPGTYPYWASERRRCNVELLTVRISLLGSYVAKDRVSDVSDVKPRWWTHQIMRVHLEVGERADGGILLAQLLADYRRGETCLERLAAHTHPKRARVQSLLLPYPRMVRMQKNVDGRLCTTCGLLAEQMQLTEWRSSLRYQLSKQP